LARDKYLEPLWRPPGGPGERKAVGLYRADDQPQLDRLFAGLPLSRWMDVSITPLRHTNDPKQHAVTGDVA
jgi:muconolactone delta-isomerase